MPKKKVNGFFLYMKDYMLKEEKKGRKINMAQAQNEAGRLWVNISEQEKGVYNQRAKKETFKAKEEVKLTSQGIPVSLIEKEKKEKDNEERLMKKEIEDTVKTNFINNTLQDQSYFFIMVNYFAKNMEENIYIPAEIGLSEYSIKEGVIKKFHSYINPAVEMFGHAYEAKVHSELTHKLPLPPNALGEKNLERLYFQILKFIQGGSSGSSTDNPGNYPPLYTHKESIPIVKSVLSYLQNDVNEYGTTDLKVYPMHYLFFTLKKATAEIGENIKPASIHVTDAILDRDQYEYERDISCDFHEKNDNGKYCALSCVVRWTFIFSENLCNDMAIKMLPGCHAPPNTVQVQSSVLSSSSFLDDQTESFSAISADITIPKLERNPWNASKSVISEDFPSLGSRKSKKREVFNESNSEMDYTNDDDEDDDDKKKKKIIKDNPWALRSKIKVKPPSENSFTFSNIVTGHGRGIIQSESASIISGTSARGHGRGRFFMNQN